jgi:hypothetical protein
MKLGEQPYDQILSYHEERNGKNIFFGWKIETNPDPTKEYIISKSVPIESDANIPEDNRGTLIFGVEDIQKIIYGYTGSTPAQFLLKWKGFEKELTEYWKNKYSNEEGIYLLKICSLIVDGEEFTLLGRNYKL